MPGVTRYILEQLDTLCIFVDHKATCYFNRFANSLQLLSTSSEYLGVNVSKLSARKTTFVVVICLPNMVSDVVLEYNKSKFKHVAPYMLQMIPIHGVDTGTPFKYLLLSVFSSSPHDPTTKSDCLVLTGLHFPKGKPDIMTYIAPGVSFYLKLVIDLIKVQYQKKCWLVYLIPFFISLQKITQFPLNFPLLPLKAAHS